MTRVRGAMTGLVAAPLAVTTLGAVLGFVNGWGPCHGIPYSTFGAYFGALVFAVFFGPPAAILGTATGAVFARGVRGLSIGLRMSMIAAWTLLLALIAWQALHFEG